MKNKYNITGIVLFCMFLGFFSCSDKSTGPNDNNPTEIETTISGTVLDENNMPVSGAQVSAHGIIKSTDANGSFLFSKVKVSKDRFVVNVSKNGYFKGSAADIPIKDGTSNIRVFLVSAGVTQSVNASSGGEAKVSNGSGVKLNANSISKADGSDYNGNVNVSVAYLDPTAENFSDLIPGGDMQAERTDNSQVTLVSYGIIKVEMKDDAGSELKIKNGNQSEITVDIPASMDGTAPATIPLWHYDNVSGLWKEEGTATKQGDKYVGMVSHFSDWNCDIPEETATIHGLVVDCNNMPVAGIRVKVGQASTTTGPDGKFERRVPANTAFNVQVLASGNFGLTSLPVAVPPIAAGNVHNVGTLEVDCPSYVTGLIRCDNEIKYGQVVISWNGGYSSQFTDSQGKFRLATDIGKDAQISIYTIDNRYKNLNITTPSNRGDSLDLGTIEVCELVVQGDNEFTVNGDGFNNRKFIFSTETSFIFGYFDPEDTTTFVWMYQIFDQDTITFWIQFKGDDLGVASDVYMFLGHNSNWYMTYPDAAGSSIVNVTKYSGVGGLIEGNFSGTLVNVFNEEVSINITNGKFSVVRVVGDKPIPKIKNTTPREVKQQLKEKILLYKR